MATQFPGKTDDLNLVTTQPDIVPLSQADVPGGTATRAHTEHHRGLGEAIVAIQNTVANWEHDHSGDTTETNKPGLRKGKKLKQENTHENADTDTTASAIHHTLGWGTYQSAPGGNTNSRLTSHDEQLQLLRDLTQHNALKTFETYDSMISWKNTASPTQLSPARQVIAYTKDRDSFYLLTSTSAPALPVLSGNPVGTVFMYAGGDAPYHALKCDGKSYAKTAYPILAEKLGNTYGGTTTHFNVPDLTGRVPVGRNSEDTDFAIRGRTGGTKTHTHTEGDLRAAVGASNEDPSVISYQMKDVGARGPKTVTRYSVKGTALSLNNRTFNHHTGVYGTTDSGTSVQPYLVLDYYIIAR